MSLDHPEDQQSLSVSRVHGPGIELIPAENQRYGFPAGQLLHYRLEVIDNNSPQGAPEQLTLAFATADVVITGWRLGRIADQLCDGALLRIRTVPSRYANLAPNQTSVASIAITPIAKDHSSG